MRALRSNSPLIVYIDVKSPYAFAAIKPTLALEAELGMQFDWRPLTLDIPSFAGAARKEKGKVVESTRSPAQWTSIRYHYRDARRYAERQGYVLKGTEKIWDSSIANIAILWTANQARERMADFLLTIFPPFWRRELDIEDISVVEDVLREAGIETEDFAAYQAEGGEGRALHDALQPQLHPAGIFGVPTYVIDGEPLHGREHIPYLRWHLTGREGQAPDIAYELETAA